MVKRSQGPGSEWLQLFVEINRFIILHTDDFKQDKHVYTVPSYEHFHSEHVFSKRNVILSLELKVPMAPNIKLLTLICLALYLTRIQMFFFLFFFFSFSNMLIIIIAYKRVFNCFFYCYM